MTLPAGRKPVLQWRNFSLDFGKRTHIMGILNATPDSFYPESRLTNVSAAMQKAEQMIADGADILDIGGESTRPGSDAVTVEQEIERIIPLILEIKKHYTCIISIDTKKIAVAHAALDAGADMVNTITGLRDDDDFARLIADADVPVILMHMKGTPKTMQKNPSYENTVNEIKQELIDLADHAITCGIKKDHIIIDPGIGFGKRVSDNLSIIKHISAFKETGFPILIGLSRKSYLETITERSVEDRLAGTIASHAIAVLNGADILRVHDVKEAIDAVQVVKAIQESK